MFKVFILMIACIINIIIKFTPSMIVLLVIHTLVYQITGISIYNSFKKHISKYYIKE